MPAAANRGGAGCVFWKNGGLTRRSDRVILQLPHGAGRDGRCRGAGAGAALRGEPRARRPAPFRDGARRFGGDRHRGWKGMVGYQSGQMEQTVNLPAYAYVGSNPTPTTARVLLVVVNLELGRGGDPRRAAHEAGGRFRGCSSVGRALQSHCRGQGFDSPHLHPEGRDVAQPGSAPEWGSGGRRFESGRPDSLGRIASSVLGTWLSPVEHSLRERGVGGSNPPVPTGGDGGRSSVG